MSESTTEQPLLSIAIPTWNRAGLLKEALECLESQIRDYKDDIELIISDNASTDETPLIISDFCEKHPDFNIVTWRQKENTGYFGNFKKVRELSTGKYLWILSDDDHVMNNVVFKIISILRHYKNLSSIFIDTNITPSIKRGNEMVDFDKLINKVGCYVTLVSSVIFYNNKRNDQEVFDKFKNNSFIGFVLFLSAFEDLNSALIVKGNFLSKNKGVVSFNVYDSWINDMAQCLEYLTVVQRENKTTPRFVNSFLKDVIRWHYINSRLYKHYIADINELKIINANLKKTYSGYKNYWLYIFVNTFVPRGFLFLPIFLRKVKNKLKKEYYKKRI